MKNNNYVIGIDLGGTKISGAVADLKGDILKVETVETQAYLGKEAVIERIKGLVIDLVDSTSVSLESIAAIGIGSPGPLDSKEGIIFDTPNLPGFDKTPIVSILKAEFNSEVFLDNDANAAALGELWFGNGRGCRNFIYVTVSTGIGCGIVINGDIYSGSTGNAGELGNIVLNLAKNDAGFKEEILEDIASGTAIAKAALKKIKNGEESILTNCKAITSREVFEAASRGDLLAKEVVDNSVTTLGIGIANAINILDPEKVIIGGGVAKSGEAFFQAVRDIVRLKCYKVMADNVKIVPAGLGDEAGIRGAVGIALSRLKEGNSNKWR